MISVERLQSYASDRVRVAETEMPQNREGTGFRGPSPNVGKATQFKPGQSGNPGGRPKRDYAAEIARAVFEDNPKQIYDAMRKALLKGNPKVFAALADRAFGKVKPSAEEGENPVTIIIDNVLVADLEEP